MAADRDDRNKDKEQPRGLRKLLGGLFAKKPPPEEDDFRPATSYVNRSAPPRMQGAQAPSRTVVAAAAAAPKGAPADEPQWDTYRPAPREAPESRVPIRGNKLYELHCRMNGARPFAKAGANFSLSLFMPQGLQPDAEQRGWFRAIERDARGMAQYAMPKPDPDKPGQPPEAFPVDAYAFVRVANDGMTAYLFILPPLDGGEPLPKEWVYRLLGEQKVNTGVDHDTIEAACEDGQYLKLLPIAFGQQPQPGEDGEVVDYFSRGVEVQLKVQDDNTIDFKDLGWLQTVREGEVICDVLLPTTGTPGKTVRGKTVPAPDGKYATPPNGPGTHISEDGTALLASLDGVLTFLGGGFRVDPLLIVKGDVDNAIGNLDVIGDILIYGDIREGYTVTASGNITVQGMVEGACVTAGGDVRIAQGMNAGPGSRLSAGGNVMAQFIENANVTADGMVVCDSIINSTVHSDSFIRVTTGRGAVVGGELRALESIEAATIGNEGGRMMTAILGATTTILQEMEQLEEKYDTLAAEIADKEKNIAYLAPMEEALSYKESTQLDDLRQGVRVQKMQLANLQRRLSVLARKQQDYSRCFLRAQHLYPPLQLIVGDVAAELRQPLENVTVRRVGDEITVEEDAPKEDAKKGPDARDPKTKILG